MTATKTSAGTCKVCKIELTASGHCSDTECSDYDPNCYDEDLNAIRVTLWQAYDIADEDDDIDELDIAFQAEMLTSLRRIETLLETLVIQKIKEGNGG